MTRLSPAMARALQSVADGYVMRHAWTRIFTGGVRRDTMEALERRAYIAVSDQPPSAIRVSTGYRAVLLTDAGRDALDAFNAAQEGHA